MTSEGKLPVHGFVLAGGKSSRMGVDKALLEFCGRPMVEIAVEKLREFCAEVSIAGNREDLKGFAEVVPEERMECGPGAGVEAGLGAARQEWAMFVPVDVPLVPGQLLRRWADDVVGRGEAGCGVSFLVVGGERQPTFCMIRRGGLDVLRHAMDAGERRLADILYRVDEQGAGWIWVCDAAKFVGERQGSECESWFSNVNTPQELREVEAFAAHDAGAAGRRNG